MATIPFALALTLGLATQETPQETWDDVAGAYEQASVAWAQEMQTSGAWERSEEERPARPERAFWPRFEALSVLGEPRATFWLIRNLDEAEEPREERGAVLFERVRSAGGARWVAKVLPVIVTEQNVITPSELAPWLAELRSTEDRDVRVAALLASAEVETERSRADELRLRAASLRWMEVEPPAGESLPDDRLAEISSALMSGLILEEHSWFKDGLFQVEENSYFPRADCPARPQDIWRSVIEALAGRGEARASAWMLSNTWPEGEEQVSQMRAQLDTLSRAEVEDKVLQELAWNVGSWPEKLGPEFVEKRVRALAERAGSTAQAALLLHLGDGLCKAAKDDASREHGLTLLRDVHQRWPDSDEEPGGAGSGGRAGGEVSRPGIDTHALKFLSPRDLCASQKKS